MWYPVICHVHTVSNFLATMLLSLLKLELGCTEMIARHLFRCAYYIALASVSCKLLLFYFGIYSAVQVRRFSDF